MPTPLLDRVAFWLERWTWLDPVILKLDQRFDNGAVRYINRLNGHVVMRGTPPFGREN